MSTIDLLHIDVPCRPGRNNLYEILLKTAPITSSVPWNEASSDSYDLTWTVTDRDSGLVLDTLRQNDRRHELHHVRIGKQHCVGRRKVSLVLAPSMPWVATDQPVIKVNALGTDDLPPDRYLIDVQMGAPSDLPFFGANWSYGEGADAHGNWFHCKRFRWTNNRFDVLVPRTPGARQTARLNLNTPVPFVVQGADGVKYEFPATQGGRWSQPFYELPVPGVEAVAIEGPAARLIVSSKHSLPGLQADLRELFAAVESVETDVYVDAVSEISAGQLLDAGYAGGEARSADARIRMLHHLGRLGYPPTPAAGGNARADVLIFLDPIYDALVSRRLETGAVWLNSVQGAALACRQLGLLARIGGLERAREIQPRLIIIPHQNMRSAESDAILGFAAERGIPILQEGSFHPETIAHWRMTDVGQFILRGDWRFNDGTEIPELWKAYVQHLGNDSHHGVPLTSVSPSLPICAHHRDHQNEYLLLGFFFYNFFSYGIHTHLRVLEKLLFESIGLKPRMRVRATAPAVFVAAAADGRTTLRILGGGAGLFPYHGIARAFSIAPETRRTDVGSVSISFSGCAAERLQAACPRGNGMQVVESGGEATITVEGDEVVELSFADIDEASQ